MVERVAAHHAFLRQQSNLLPDLRWSSHAPIHLGHLHHLHHHHLHHHHLCIFTIMIASDEDYVDALLLSQQNCASSSLLDLALVEVIILFFLLLLIIRTWTLFATARDNVQLEVSSRFTVPV